MAFNVVNQRLALNTRLLAYSEGSSPGTDPGSPVGQVLPVRDASGWQLIQNTTDAPVYHLGVTPDDRVPNMYQFGGLLPMGLEYVACPNFLKWSFPNYTKTNLPTGAYHDFYIPPPGTVVAIGSFQIQGESMESAAQYLRGPYQRVSKISTSYAASGAAPFDVTVMGSGAYSLTDLGGTKNDFDYKATNMFNGQALLGGILLAGMPVFSIDIDTGLTQFGGAFNGGAYTSVNPGKINWAGNCEIANAVGGSTNESDFTYMKNALAQANQAFRCMWANGPLRSMTAFMDFDMRTVRFGASSVKFGGKPGLSTTQPFNGTYDSTASKTAAYVHGTVAGPYVIVTGTTDTFSVKIDGGSTINVVFAAGTYTAAGLVALLNANGTFSASAVADSWGVTVADGQGYVRVTSKATGSTSSVQFQTGTAQNVGALLGFGNTAVAGYNTPFLVRVYSPSQVAYA